MYVARFNEYFGYDYQLMDVETVDILENIYDSLGYIPRDLEPIDLEIVLEEFYNKDKIYVLCEADDEEIEFCSCIDEVAPEVIIDFLKSKGHTFIDSNA
ncbi:hypothetical protein DFW61_08715 [Campylobacter coli]|nr:hypothetical protein [Campylobacter coli]